MISFQSFSKEIDELDLVVRQFEDEIKAHTLFKNTCGIVYASHEADIAELTGRLSKTFDFPFIGCTGLGILNSEGYADEQISLLVLTASDCEFGVALSDSLSEADTEEELRKAYDEARSRLPEKEKVIISYMPWNFDISYDKVVATLDKLSEGVPVFGGVSSDTWSFTETLVFTNGKVSRDGAVMLLISGNIDPILRVEQSVVPVPRTTGKVTKASDRIVYEIEGITAENYLANKGILPAKTSVMDSFLVAPFIVSMEEDGEKISALRTLDHVDQENGSCGFVGNIDEGSEITLSYISKDEMSKSVNTFLDKLISDMKKEGTGKYSTILCSSCASRYCLIVADKSTEARGYVGKLPENVNFQGVYLFGEFCPGKGGKSGRYYNRFNNETFAILAF